MGLTDFKDRVSIVGVGTTSFGALYRTRDPRRNAYTLGLEAFENALEDCGLPKDDIDDYNAPFGMTSPGASVALMWQRHMHEYGTTQEDLGMLAISQRKFASMNPNAVMRAPLTMDAYMNARYICYPLRLCDYCLINDGGVCFIVTTAERAKDCRKPPIK